MKAKTDVKAGRITIVNIAANLSSVHQFGAFNTAYVSQTAIAANVV